MKRSLPGAPPANTMTQQGWKMARNNFKYEKYKRDQAKKQKQEQKRLQKLEKRNKKTDDNTDEIPEAVPALEEQI